MVIVLSEKEAAIFLSNADGGVDYAGFTGTAPVFHQWARELFLYFWDKATRA